MTFLEREKQLRELADDAARRYKEKRTSLSVEMNERWAPAAQHEYEELFYLNAKEILAVVEAAQESVTVESDDSLLCQRLIDALDELDKKAGEG